MLSHLRSVLVYKFEFIIFFVIISNEYLGGGQMSFIQKTKHELVIHHIKTLPIGEKVSVRRLAKDLKISEGTVYRAIKEAENLGLVSSIPKVGTIRIEPDVERSIDSLSYEELVSALEGRFISGIEFKRKTPKAYFVATGTDKLRLKNLSNEVLIIAEYNSAIISYVFEKEMPLLLCGHEKLTADEVKKATLSQQLLISTPHEIFETISLINQVIFEKVKNRELIRIEAIRTKNPWTLYVSDTVSQWHDLFKRTGYSRFPVIDNEGRLRGLVTARDITNAPYGTPISEVMVSNPLTVKKEDLVGYLARLLVWESIELVPVIDEEKLVGVVSRQDIIEALQSLQKQPQFGETFDNTVMSGFSLEETEPNVVICGKSLEFMTNEYRKVSVSNLSTIAINLSIIALRLKFDLITEVIQITLNQLDSIGLEEEMRARAIIYPLRKNEFQVFVEIISNDKVMAVATVLLVTHEK